MPKGVARSGRRMTKKYLASLNGTVHTTYKAPAAFVPVESRFTINQRFGFVTDMVQMLAKGKQASVVITGPGGLGKTFTVLKALEGCGLKDISSLESFEVGTRVDPKKAFRCIKGYATPKGLYRALYENKDGILVFDDCDSVLKEPTSLSLLKGALDSYSKRILSYRADIRDEDLPNVFEFNGKVVFISNLPSQAMDQAIITRSLAVDLAMTTAQKVDRIRFLANDKGFMEDQPQQFKNDAVDLIDSLKDRIRELSLRTLIQVVNIRASAPMAKWKDLSEYACCG